MGTVLAFAVQNCVDTNAWLVALADMPYIAPTTYSKLLAALDEHELVAPEFDGQRGHPVGFQQCYLLQLLALQGEHGARALMTRKPIFLLTTDDPGVLRDIDLAADLSAPIR